MRNYVSSTFEKWYIAIYVMKLEKSHLTGPIRVVPELTPFIYLHTSDFTVENHLSYILFCLVFATAADRRIISMVLVRTKLF